MYCVVLDQQLSAVQKGLLLPADIVNVMYTCICVWITMGALVHGHLNSADKYIFLYIDLYIFIFSAVVGT